MDVSIPVYLYDVTTTDASPRLIVSCRDAATAQHLATRLNALQGDGKLGVETFTAASPREATVTMPVIPGSTVLVQGYQVDVESLAGILFAAQAAP